MVVLVLAAATLIVGGAPAGAHTPHDVIVDVAVSPAYAKDHTVLAISDNRVLRSTDGGRHFREAVVDLDPTFSMARFGFAPSDPSVVYLTSRGGGVYRSDDGGLRWHSTGNASGISAGGADLVVSPTSADVVVVRQGIFGGLFRTDDGGETWAVVPGVYGVNVLTSVPGRAGRVVAGDSKGAILLSDDDGKTFRSLGPQAGASSITAITAGPSGALFAGTKDGGVLHSADGGDSWSAIGRRLPGPPVQSLLVSPADAHDRTVWASTWHRGAFRSTDGGATWTARSRGLTTDEQADRIHSPQFREIVAAPRAGGQRLFLGGYDGLFLSDDDGARWTPIQTQAEYPSGLAVSPDYGTDHTVVVNTYLKGCLISRDGGRTFTPSNRGLQVDALSEGNKYLPLRRMHNVVFSPDYAHDHTIFTATWTRFVRSQDGGRTWTSVLVAPPPPDTDLRQFVIGVSPTYAQDHTVFLGTRQGDLYRSVRGGAEGSWVTAAELGGWVRSIAVSPAYATDHTVFAGTERGVLKSSDGGSTWTTTPGPSELALLAISPDFPTDHTLFAGTRLGLEVTRDGGDSWTTTGLPPPTPPRAVAAVAVSPAFGRDGTVLASVDGTGLFRSRDRGRTFTAIAPGLRRRGLVIADFDRPTSEPIQFSGNFAEDRTVYAYAQVSLLRSTDGGTHWTVLALPSAAEVGASLAGGPTRAPAPDDGGGGSVPWAAIFAIAIVVVVALGVTLVLVRRRRTRDAGT